MTENPLDHDLNRFFEKLSRFESTRELYRSDLYRQLEPQIARILNHVVSEGFVERAPEVSRSFVRATSWNSSSPTSPTFVET